MGRYSGSFSTPGGHRIGITWQKWSGLEEYSVDREIVLSRRMWACTGVREFSAGPHRIRVRFDIPKQVCKAYVDGRLVQRDVFQEFRSNRQQNRRFLKRPNPGLSNVYAKVAVFIAIFVALSWLASLASE
jgi:hypothetical protein